MANTPHINLGGLSTDELGRVNVSDIWSRISSNPYSASEMAQTIAADAGRAGATGTKIRLSDDPAELQAFKTAGFNVAGNTAMWGFDTSTGETAAKFQAKYGTSTGSTQGGTTTYPDLVNVNGTIYNNSTGQGYSTPEQLATDLGIQPHEIDWTKIKQSNTVPGVTTQTEDTTTETPTTTKKTETTTGKTETPDETKGIKEGERAILPDGRQFVKQPDGSFRWIENNQVLSELIAQGKVTGGLTQVGSESALGSIGNPIKFSEASGADDLEIEKQIRDIYDTNFGRQPTQSELDNQLEAVKTGGQPALDNITEWAQTHPENVATTGQPSQPQPSQGEPLESLDQTQDVLNQLPPELADLYETMSGYIESLAEQGQQINPDIEITPELTEQFLTQAKDEFGEFFSGEQLGILTDLQRTLGRDIELTQRGEEDIGREFIGEFRETGESAAERGMAFSGSRLRSERELAEATNREIARGREDLAFGAGGSTLTAERAVGSEALGGFSFPTIKGAPMATRGGLFGTSPQAGQVGSATGGILGTLPSQQQTAEQTRASELENVYRQRNLLNV